MRDNYYQQEISRLKIRSVSRHASDMRTSILTTPNIFYFLAYSKTFQLIFNSIHSLGTYTNIQIIYGADNHDALLIPMQKTNNHE